MFKICVCMFVIVNFWTCSSQDIETKNNQINFTIEPDKQFCTADNYMLKVKQGKKIRINFQTNKNADIQQRRCHPATSSSEMPMKSDYEIRHSLFIIEMANTTAGPWRCLVHVKNNDGNRVTVKCQFEILLLADSPQSPFDWTWVYIGIGVGVAIIIIIAQTIVILYFKSKAKIAARIRRLSTRIASEECGRVRYSILPGLRRKKNQKSGDKTGENELYEIITPPTNPIAESSPPAVHKRPPLPIPTEDEHLYEDESVLQTVLPPKPPSIDTLPKKKPEKKADKCVAATPPPTRSKLPPPIPAKPLPPEPIVEYDYTDKIDIPVHLHLASEEQRDHQQQNGAFVDRYRDAEKPRKPLFKGKPGKSACAPIVSELDDIFKRRKIGSSDEVQPAARPPMLPGRPPKPTTPLMKHTPAVAVSPVIAKKIKKPLPPPPSNNTQPPVDINHLPGASIPEAITNDNDEFSTFDELPKYNIYNL